MHPGADGQPLQRVVGIVKVSASHNDAMIGEHHGQRAACESLFLRQQGVESILGLLDEQIEFCQRYVSEWKALVQSTEPDSFDCLAMQSRVAAAQGTLDWLIQYRQRLSGEASQSHRPAGARRRRSG